MRNGDVRVWCWLLLCARMLCTELSLLPVTLASSLTFTLCRQCGLHSSCQAQGEGGGEWGSCWLCS